MKKLCIIILSMIFLTRSYESLCQDSTVYFKSGNGELESELKLHANKTFSETQIDWHGGFGGIRTGTYSWNKQLLILKYGESEQTTFFFDSTRLFRVRELSYFEDSSSSSTKYVELSYDSSLITFSKPVRQSWSSWTFGKYENFDDQVNEFKKVYFFKEE